MPKNYRLRLYALHKHYLRWIGDQNVKCKTVKPLEDNKGANLVGLELMMAVRHQHEARGINKMLLRWTPLKFNILPARTLQ